MRPDRVEHGVQAVVEWRRLFVELPGAIVMAGGVAMAALALLRQLADERGGGCTPVRLFFGPCPTLALALSPVSDDGAHQAATAAARNA